MSAAAEIHLEQDALRADYMRVRRHSLERVQGLSAEDCLLQSMEEASPLKWHLGHTNWFFESFVLAGALRDFTPCEPAWHPLFNSYYLSLGEPHARARRGLLARPSLEEVLAWRSRVDMQVLALLATALAPEWRQLLALGLQHEQQHQELMLTDLKHHFWCNPLHPVYRPASPPAVEETPAAPASLNYRACEGGLVEIGHDGEGFAFDNEGPRHRCWLPPFTLATRLVTNGEYLAFMVDGGYGRPGLWLADGWERRRRENWQAPLYWLRCDEQWCHYTLTGVRPLRLHEPVCHVSFYEADAYARWARARLPAEAEWEHEVGMWQASEATGGEGVMATGQAVVESESLRDVPVPSGELLALHPEPAVAGDAQCFGTVWQWTQSAYLPYPGFRTPPGPLGEYNGKFMSNQMVLRGSSCVTPAGHARPSYRNFLAPHSRWQFTGIRLARDLP